jgi:hypothetical protein
MLLQSARPVGIGLLVGGMLAIGLGAALRAGRVDPVVALRRE